MKIPEKKSAADDTKIAERKTATAERKRSASPIPDNFGVSGIDAG
jgi:hypothetical protein